MYAEKTTKGSLSTQRGYQIVYVRRKDHQRISEDTERISNSIYTLKMTTKGSLSTQRGYQIVYVRRKDHQRISEHTERISNSICTQKRPSKDL
jgi:vacuolar-type H+-ATPase subunit F/Vma7